MDFIESGKLATDSVKFFVLDEADRLLDPSNQDVILKMFSKFPKAATGTQRLQVSRPHLAACLICSSCDLRAASGSRQDSLVTQRLQVELAACQTSSGHSQACCAPHDCWQAGSP